MENELRDHLATTFSRPTQDHCLTFAVAIPDRERVAGLALNDHFVLSRGHRLVTIVEVEWHLHNQSLRRFTIRGRRRSRRQRGNQYQHRGHSQNLLCHLSSSPPLGS